MKTLKITQTLKGLKALFFASALIVLSSTAMAQSNWTPGVSARQDNQQDRIAQGVVSGELTKVETIKLVNDQRELKAMKQIAKADGKVTRRERKALQRKQNQNSKAIKRQKNDAQSRF